MHRLGLERNAKKPDASREQHSKEGPEADHPLVSVQFVAVGAEDHFHDGLSSVLEEMRVYQPSPRKDVTVSQLATHRPAGRPA